MARRGSYAKGLAKREEILDAALSVVAREGYKRASVREIAAAVELSQAGLMHHFASKDQLFTEILRRRDEVDTAMVDDDENISALAILPLSIKHNTEVPGLVQLYVSFAAEATAPGHIAQEFFIDRFDRYCQKLSADIRQKQTMGELRSELDADFAARSLLALADGLQTQWLLDPTFDMAAYLTSVIDSWRCSPR